MNETITTPDTFETGVAQETKALAGGLPWRMILVWGGVIAILALLGWGLLNNSATRPEAGAQAPLFDMQFYDGYEWQGQRTASLSDWEGNVVVLNFWASWCVECRLEADLLEDAWRQYADDSVIFVGVAYVDAERKAKAYLEEFQITYPNAPDLASTISDDYKITGVPETFFIDKNGEIARVVIGPVNEQTLHGQITQLLAQ